MKTLGSLEEAPARKLTTPLPGAVMNPLGRVVGLLACLVVVNGCAIASAPPPSDPAHVVRLPQFPAAGTRYAAERNGEQEIWVVKDANGTIEFHDRATDAVRLTIQLGPCFSFARMPRRHDFAAAGSPAYLTAPPDCQVWDGRSWAYNYAVKIYAQPCSYAGHVRATVTGAPGHRLVTSTTYVGMTGPGARNGYETWQVRLVYSEELGFFKELDPGYIGAAEVLHQLK